MDLKFPFGQIAQLCIKTNSDPLLELLGVSDRQYP